MPREEIEALLDPEGQWFINNAKNAPKIGDLVEHYQKTKDDGDLIVGYRLITSVSRASGMYVLHDNVKLTKKLGESRPQTMSEGLTQMSNTMFVQPPAVMYAYEEQPIFTTLTPVKAPQVNMSMGYADMNTHYTSPNGSPPNQMANYDEMEDEDDLRMDTSFDRNGSSSQIVSGEPCLVCGGIAKGLHFQVNSCRACAAFFRRSTKSKLVYRCQRGTGKCDLTYKVKGKPLCRYCRMKKCTSVGMRIEAETIPSLDSANNSPLNSASSDNNSVQTWNRDLVRSEIRFEGRRIVYDTKPLVAMVKESLIHNRVNSLTVPSGISLTTMQRMSYAITRFIQSYTPKIGEIQVVTEIGADCGMRFQEDYILRLTELATSCEYFVSLPPADKFPLFKRFWIVFQQIERAYQTMLVFGNEVNDCRFLVDDKKAIDMDLAKVKFEYVQIENAVKLLEPIKERLFTHLMNPLRALRPTLFEMAYIAQHCMWSCFEIGGLSPETYKTAEEVLERISNELHNYYVYEMHIQNYAARHAALLRLVSVAEFIIRSKKDMMITAKVFDIIENDFFESELVQ